MTNTIKWHYKGTDIYFLSTEDNFERHKLQNAGRLNLTDPEIIIIENATTDNSPTTGAPCRNCGTSTETKPTIPVGTKKAKTPKQTTDGLFYMSGISPDVDSAVDPVDTDEPDLDLLGGTVDRMAL